MDFEFITTCFSKKKLFTKKFKLHKNEPIDYNFYTFAANVFTKFAKNSF